APRASRQLISQFVQENGRQINAPPEEWHTYAVDWKEDGTRFFMDDALVMKVQSAPKPPLGLVMWVDNQFAAFRPDQGPRWGLEASTQAAWLEIEAIRLSGSA
ncbi:MAG: family 16 glycosylhydrolase, partial [Anaerolineales bacterium]